MLWSVLGSPRAIAVNIEITRTLVRGRAIEATQSDLAKRLAELEDKTEALAMNHDAFSRNTRNQLKQVFDALRELMTPACQAKRPVGFINPEDEGGKQTGGEARLKAGSRPSRRIDPACLLVRLRRGIRPPDRFQVLGRGRRPLHSIPPDARGRFQPHRAHR